jgi:CRISPR/Cas system Type II protein with McrA/HNH and RuvC-like nuclease domain
MNAIHIELAREVHGGEEQRAKTTKTMRENEEGIFSFKITNSVSSPMDLAAVHRSFHYYYWYLATVAILFYF